MIHATESEFEKNTIERLKGLGYEYLSGGEIERESFKDVILDDRLLKFIKTKYPEFPEETVQEILLKVKSIPGARMDLRNKAFHELLVGGFEISTNKEVKSNSSKEAPIVKNYHIYLIDWENPEENDFLVVNQFSISGNNDRRPDIIIFINGLPLVLFELKNPHDSNTTVEGAFQQIQHYKNDIPLLFDYNEIVVLSDGGVVGEPDEDTPKTHGTYHGMWNSSFEWYSPWKTINGEKVEKFNTGAMKTLIEGLFPKERLLSYIKYFILFETSGDLNLKKGAKYHQFFAIRFAIEKAQESIKPKADKRIGVIWHTQGSGKSLSMLFFSQILRKNKEFKNPTILIQVDRNDLDKQLYDQFVLCKSYIGSIQHAESVQELRSLLRSEGGEIIFSTIEKFQLLDDESDHPVLSNRDNIIVIADEAHRTQYGHDVKFKRNKKGELYKSQGFARSLRQSLPFASFIGFTGTPVDKADSNTYEIFGDVIHTYDMKQAQQDGATVPIFYEAKIIPLSLKNEKIDEELEEITEGEEESSIDYKKSKWAAIANAAGAKERLETLAKDLVSHFNNRRKDSIGKAMIVCMSRENCVRLYNALAEIPNAPEAKIVMTGNLSKDPKEWSEKGFITTKKQRDDIKARMKDYKDPLQIVIVRDMWLTGTDIPCLDTLYIDKPMNGHNLMQAIARVNRVFSSKQGGLIVDYIGIGEDLKKATKKYTDSGGEGNPAEDLNEKAVAIFLEKLGDIKNFFPVKYQSILGKLKDPIAFEDILTEMFGFVIEDEKTMQIFLEKVSSVSRSFSLVSHLKSVSSYSDEVAIYQLIESQVRKYKTPPRREIEERREQAIRSLLDRSISSGEVKDIFALVGIPTPGVSIITDEFLRDLQENKKYENLRLKLLEKILYDSINIRFSVFPKKKKSFKELLEATLKRYHAREISLSELLARIKETRDKINEEDSNNDLELSPEELSFYEAVTFQAEKSFDNKFLADLLRDVVKVLKTKLKPDWTEDYKEQVRAGVENAVKLILKKKGVKEEQFKFLYPRIIEHAKVLYHDWPLTGTEG